MTSYANKTYAIFLCFLLIRLAYLVTIPSVTYETNLWQKVEHQNNIDRGRDDTMIYKIIWFGEQVLPIRDEYVWTNHPWRCSQADTEYHDTMQPISARQLREFSWEYYTSVNNDYQYIYMYGWGISTRLYIACLWRRQ